MPYPSDIKFDTRLTVYHEKLFENTPPPTIDLTILPALPTDWISQLNAIFANHHKNLAQALDKHIGDQSTYPAKSDLIESLKIVFCYLSNRLERKIGSISEGKHNAAVSKLVEGIRNCTEGFHNRVFEVIASIILPTSFAMLLHFARESLVLQMSATLTNDVHTSNTIINIAHHNNFGVRLRNQTDPYYGTLTETVIIDSLKQRFAIDFNPLAIPSLICDQIRGLLVEHGYTGRKTGYVSTEQTEFCSYDIHEIKCFENLIKATVGVNIKEFLIDETDLDEITVYIRDLDWRKIRITIFNKMISEGYFDIPPSATPQNLLEYASGYFTQDEKQLPTLLDNTFETENKAYAASIVKQCILLFPEFSQTLVKPCCFSKLLEKSTDSKNTVMLLLSELPQEAILEFLRALIPEDKNKNDLERIGIALYQAAEDNTTELPIIAECLLAFIQKTSPNDMTDLITALSEKKSSGDDQNVNALYWIMNALHYSTTNNPRETPKITSCLFALINKTPKEAMPTLIAGLCEKKISGDVESSNVLYWMMTALNCIAAKTPGQLTAITDCLFALINKTPEEVLPALIAGLSEKITLNTDQGSNALHWVMSALNWTAENNPDQIPAITRCLLALIDNTPKEALTALIAGLSEKRTSGNPQGTNPLYWMMTALNWTAKNNPDQIPAITNCLLALIDNIPKEAVTALIAGLFNKRTAGNTQGSNAFYWMMNALHCLTETNPRKIPKITSCLFALINKTSKEALPALITGLWQKMALGNDQGINPLYLLMKALYLTAKNNPTEIPEITNYLFALIDNTPPETLPALITELCEKKISSNDQGTNAWHWMMNALILTTETNPTQLPTITRCLLALINKAPKEALPALIRELSEKRTSTPDTGTNALYSMMNTLCFLVNNNPTEISQITDCLLALINNTPKEALPALITGLSEKTTPDNIQGINALYLMVNALVWAAEKSLTEIAQITSCLSALINNTPKEALPALIAALSEKITGNINALQFMMYALSWAAEKNSDQLPTITSCLLALINNTPKEALHTLIAGLSDKKTSGDDQGTNALYWMMNALHSVTRNNPAKIPEITSCLLALINNTEPEALPLLIAGLSEKSNEDTSALYWMTNALTMAAEKNADQLPAITSCLLALIDNTPKEALHTLIAGLSDKKTSGDDQGINALYWMMNALYSVTTNNPAKIPEITSCLLALINNTEPEALPLLIAGLSEKNNENTSALYWMTNALTVAAEKNADQLPAITSCLLALINNTPKEALPTLIGELSKSDFQGENPLYWLMNALYFAVENKTTQIPAITNCLLALINKTPKEVLATLIAGLSEKSTSVIAQGANPLYLIISALNSAAKNNPAETPEIAGCLLALIQKMPEECFPVFISALKAIKSNKKDFYYFLLDHLIQSSVSDFTAKIFKVCCSLRKGLAHTLQEYLTSKFKSPSICIEEMCNEATYFGQLMDYNEDQSTQDKKSTKSRDFINKELKLRQQNQTNTSSSAFFRAPSKTDLNDSSENTQGNDGCSFNQASSDEKTCLN